MLTIRRQLLLGLLAATLLCVLGAGISLFRSLLEETNELADLQLRQLAVALPDEFEPQAGLVAAQALDQAFPDHRIVFHQQHAHLDLSQS